MTGLKYDSSDSLSIEAYAKLLIGKTFLDIINDADLNKIAYHGWKNIQNKIKSGVSLNKIETKNGYEIKNDLPKKKDNKIIHIRPHTAKRAYILSSGEIIGNVKKHANELPDGQWMTTQSFWINNDYILSQIKL